MLRVTVSKYSTLQYLHASRKKVSSDTVTLGCGTLTLGEVKVILRCAKLVKKDKILYPFKIE